MTTATVYFNIKRGRAWDERRFRVWVAGGAFRGASPGPNSADIWRGISAGTTGDGGLVVLFALLPFILVWSRVVDRNEQFTRQQIDALSPDSDKYLEWNKRNFRLRAADILRAESFETSAWLSPSTRVQKLELRLKDGQQWRFTLNNHAETDALSGELNQSGIAATWRENR